MKETEESEKESTDEEQYRPIIKPDYRYSINRNYVPPKPENPIESNYGNTAIGYAPTFINKYPTDYIPHYPPNSQYSPSYINPIGSQTHEDDTEDDTNSYYNVQDYSQGPSYEEYRKLREKFYRDYINQSANFYEHSRQYQPLPDPQLTQSPDVPCSE